MSSQRQKRALRLIQELDLEPIRERLVKIGTFTEARSFEFEKEYRRFLTLKVLHPNETIVPSHGVDLFWHEHLHFTEKYTSDCENIFGKFLHHDPTLEVGSPNYVTAKTLTQNLYQSEFGGGPVWARDSEPNVGNRSQTPHYDDDPDCG